MLTTSVNNLCHVYVRGTLVMFLQNITYVQCHNLRLGKVNLSFTLVR